MAERWEYIVEYITDDSDIEARLDSLGDEGWDLVAVTEKEHDRGDGTSYSAFMLFLKRRLWETDDD